MIWFAINLRKKKDADLDPSTMDDEDLSPDIAAD
jgi:hypothetical protein